MKICRTCNESKPDIEFDYRGGGRKGPQADCKLCSRARLKEHRQQIRKLVSEYKLAQGCVRCGYDLHPQALHLDHIDPKTKRNPGNSRAFEPSWSVERVMEELHKCQVLCANCHAIKTFENNEHISN